MRTGPKMSHLFLKNSGGKSFYAKLGRNKIMIVMMKDHELKEDAAF